MGYTGKAYNVSYHALFPRDAMRRDQLSKAAQFHVLTTHSHPPPLRSINWSIHRCHNHTANYLRLWGFKTSTGSSSDSGSISIQRFTDGCSRTSAGASFAIHLGFVAQMVRLNIGTNHHHKFISTNHHHGRVISSYSWKWKPKSKYTVKPPANHQ